MNVMPQMSLIPTEPVDFSRPHVSYGERGERSVVWEQLGTFGCGVEPVDAGDMDEGLHPNGARRTVRIHVPSSLKGSLRACRAVVRGEAYDIEGDPMPLAASPLAFDRSAKAVRADG